MPEYFLSNEPFYKSRPSEESTHGPFTLYIRLHRRNGFIVCITICHFQDICFQSLFKHDMDNLDFVFSAPLQAGIFLARQSYFIQQTI